MKEIILKRAADLAEALYRNTTTTLPPPRSPVSATMAAAAMSGFNAYAASAGQQAICLNNDDNVIDHNHLQQPINLVNNDDDTIPMNPFQSFYRFQIGTFFVFFLIFHYFSFNFSFHFHFQSLILVHFH